MHSKKVKKFILNRDQVNTRASEELTKSNNNSEEQPEM